MVFININFTNDNVTSITQIGVLQIILLQKESVIKVCFKDESCYKKLYASQKESPTKQ